MHLKLTVFLHRESLRHHWNFVAQPNFKFESVQAEQVDLIL